MPPAAGAGRTSEPPLVRRRPVGSAAVSGRIRPVDDLQAGRAEHGGVEVLAVGFEARQKLGDDPRPAEGAEDVAVLVDTGLIEDADILQLDLVAADPGDLG